MPKDSREEAPGSPVEGRGIDGSWEATRVTYCDWEDRYFILQLLTSLGGEQYPFGDGEGGTDAYCINANVKPQAGQAVDVGPSGLASYARAVITAKYGQRTDGPRI